MKPFDHIIRILFSAIPALLSFPSCSGDGNGMDSPEPQPETIKINTVAVGGSRAIADGSDFDDTFMILLWDTSNVYFLENENYGIPYHRSISPQPVMFYSQSAYDTCYPYLPENRDDNQHNYLYATGYAPGNMLEPKLPENSNTHNYEILTANVPEKQRGRYDFLSCDLWKNVYRGSLDDPFSQEKNKLYFRHLAAKLTFYADRDKETMEYIQYVRNVTITNLRMSINDGSDWFQMPTPCKFEWKALKQPEGNDNGDFTKAYLAAIDKANEANGIAKESSSYPSYGYKATEATTVNSIVLKRPNVDRIPISGMDIDSCYVCNPINADGSVLTGQIQLRMDISADMSFHPAFPHPDNDPNTNDLTFTREWKDVTVTEITEIDADGNPIPDKFDADGNPTAYKLVTEFKPGHEYRINIHFFRSGINLVAKEMPWNHGGIHYVTINGSDKKQGS